MGLRINNATKVIDAFYYGNYYNFNKSDKLRLTEDNVISDQNTAMGKIVEFWDDALDSYSQFLVLTMKNYKSQPTWKSHKLQLIRSAREHGLPVIFVPEIDIGFGVLDKTYDILSDNYKDLIEVAKYSTDPDIKTSCLVCSGYKVVAYSFNQEIDGEMLHAEEVLMRYIRYLEYKDEIDNKYGPYTVLSLLEPCFDCLHKLIEQGATRIYFSQLHKDKWNTEDYIQLTNDIWANQLGLLYPVKYDRLENSLVTKFYSKEAK